MTSAAADIARFAVRMDGNGAIGAKHGFDNLTFTYPDNALPDLSLSVRPGEAHRAAGRLRRHPDHGHAAQWLGGCVHARRERPAAGRHGAVRELDPAPARGGRRPAGPDPARHHDHRDAVERRRRAHAPFHAAARARRVELRARREWDRVLRPLRRRRAGAAGGARPHVQRHRHPDGQRPPGGRHRDSRTSGDPAGWRLPRRRQDPPERGQTVRRCAVHRRSGWQGGDVRRRARGADRFAAHDPRAA